MFSVFVIAADDYLQVGEFAYYGEATYAFILIL
jgi:hypothetical protein